VNCTIDARASDTVGKRGYLSIVGNSVTNKGEC
jgi:hypothetical protein